MNEKCERILKFLPLSPSHFLFCTDDFYFFYFFFGITIRIFAISFVISYYVQRNEKYELLNWTWILRKSIKSDRKFFFSGTKKYIPHKILLYLGKSIHAFKSIHRIILFNCISRRIFCKAKNSVNAFDSARTVWYRHLLIYSFMCASHCLLIFRFCSMKTFSQVIDCHIRDHISRSFFMRVISPSVLASSEFDRKCCYRFFQIMNFSIYVHISSVYFQKSCFDISFTRYKRNGRM